MFLVYHSLIAHSFCLQTSSKSLLDSSLSESNIGRFLVLDMSCELPKQKETPTIEEKWNISNRI